MNSFTLFLEFAIVRQPEQVAVYQRLRRCLLCSEEGLYELHHLLLREKSTRVCAVIPLAMHAFAKEEFRGNIHRETLQQRLHIEHWGPTSRPNGPQEGIKEIFDVCFEEPKISYLFTHELRS